MAASEAGQRYVVVGRVAAVFGVRGWVKVMSETEPRENILDYAPWYLARNGAWEPRELVEGRAHGKGVVARLDGCDDRDTAASLVGCDIAVPRERLPEPAPGEYYWTDLVGLAVRTVDGVELGRVDHLLETGANDVLVVVGERERLIPLLFDQVVRQIDLQGGTITVDWDPEF